MAKKSNKKKEAELQSTYNSHIKEMYECLDNIAQLKQLLKNERLSLRHIDSEIIMCCNQAIEKDLFIKTI